MSKNRCNNNTITTQCCDQRSRIGKQCQLSTHCWIPPFSPNNIPMPSLFLLKTALSTGFTGVGRLLLILIPLLMSGMLLLKVLFPLTIV